ncbi:hypothetical protein LSAT2_024518 [Lamellibrachia satsuma]|nr:hypothetical protein LSAT2_024518 [Lamellibrachia satsuma]
MTVGARRPPMTPHPPPAPPIITIEGAAEEGRVVSGGQPDGERPRRRSTVLGVTQEARIVLEQFLKRSLSQNDASPYQHEQHQAIMEVIEEHPDMRILRSDSYQQAALANKLVERGGQTGDSEEPAYVYPHQLVYTTNSISSEGSYGVSLKSGATSRSPSDKVTLAVHPPKVKAKGKKTTRFDASSSSSTEDYEYVDNELLTRKKKSFFRWASERLRQSFRRKKERAGELESPKDEAALPMPFEEKPSKKKKGRLAAALSLKRNASERSKSSSTPNEAVSDSRTYVKEAHAKPSGGEVVTLHADDTEQMAERKKSPVPWKHNKRKDGHLVDEGGSRDRGVFENFLRQIRKGSMRLRRKGSKEHQRSKSADNLTMRQLTKDDEKVLRRFVDPRHYREVGYDSDKTDLRSFHDTTGQDTGGDQIFKPVGLGPLPPTPPQAPASTGCSRRQGHHSLREKMHLDGLVPCRPTLCRDESDDYAELDDVVGAGMGAEATHMESDGFDEADGGAYPKLSRTFMGNTNKPFNERTEKEKDELYERIAEQLSTIADQYNIDSPNSPDNVSSSDGAQDTVAPPIVDLAASGAAGERCKNRVKSSSLEKKLGALLRAHGDSADKNMTDAGPVIAELVRNASYSKFKQIVNENIGNEPGWQQIAMMFRLTQTSVQLAGMGTAVALQIKEMTLQYFEDKFASWIVGQGGWESMVEDTNTELDSELD